MKLYILLELLVKFIKKNDLLEIILKTIQSIIFYPKASLWYIQATIIACIIIYILSKYITIIQLILLSTFLYFILLLCNNYYFLIENTIIQKIVDRYLNIAISARNGIFMGIPFLTIGILVEKKWKNYIKICKYFLIISLLFYIFEIYLLKAKIYVDDGGVYLMQIFCAPILLINILKIEKNQKIVLSEEKSILFRNLSSGMYFLHRIILYIIECIIAIFNLKVNNMIIFLLVLFISYLICKIAYKYPILKCDKLLK